MKEITFAQAQREELVNKFGEEKIKTAEALLIDAKDKGYFEDKNGLKIDLKSFKKVGNEGMYSQDGIAYGANPSHPVLYIPGKIIRGDPSIIGKGANLISPLMGDGSLPLYIGDIAK